MTLDLATRATGSYPADLRGGAGIGIKKQGLRADLSIDLRNTQMLDATPAAGLVPVQDPVTGLVQALDFSKLPTANPGDGSVGNVKLTPVPSLTVKGNTTGATAQPQDVPLPVLTSVLPPATASLKGLMPAADKAKSDTLEAATSNATAVAGSQARVSYQFGESPAFPFKNIAGIWSSKVLAKYSFVEQYAQNSAPGPSPLSPLWGFAVDDASGGDVVGGMFLGLAARTNSVVFGFNAIALSIGGVNNAKLVGGEIDVEPTAGQTVAPGCGGQFTNAFNYNGLGPMLQGGGVNGYFDNGVILGGISPTGAGVAPSAGSQIGSCINSGSATYNQDFIIANANHKIRFGGQSKIYSDGGNTRVPITGGAFLFRDAADAANALAISGGGSVGLGPSGSISAGVLLDIGSAGNSEGNGHFRTHDPDGVVSITVVSGRGGPPGSGGATVKINGHTSGTSLRLGAAIAVNGADYAEYKRKRDDCGEIAKGQIIGLDENSQITDVFKLAIRFGVKTTNPNLVGGDDFAQHLGPPPVEPVYVPTIYNGLAEPIVSQFDPGEAPERPNKGNKQSARAAATGLGFDRSRAKWLSRKEAHDSYLAQKAGYEAEYPVWKAAEATRKETWLRDVYAPYLALETEFSIAYEAERAKVDRIAYCGDVPANVYGAKPGDWIVAAEGPDGSIIGVVKARDDMKPWEFHRSYGWQVGRILEDGRAEVAV